MTGFFHLFLTPELTCGLKHLHFEKTGNDFALIFN